jgi:hypothetical protein
MDILKSPAGQIVKSPNGYTAFVPNPLPPKMNWNTQIEILEILEEPTKINIDF